VLDYPIPEQVFKAMSRFLRGYLREDKQFLSEINEQYLSEVNEAVLIGS